VQLLKSHVIKYENKVKRFTYKSCAIAEVESEKVCHSQNSGAVGALGGTCHVGRTEIL
jgi:hypothetical protein